MKWNIAGTSLDSVKWGEELWRNNRGMKQSFLQWKRGKTWAWRWFLDHKDIMNTVTECRSVSSRRAFFVCARRLDCKSGQGCTWKLARDLGPVCGDETIERTQTTGSLPPLSILCVRTLFGHHKATRRWTRHSPNRQHHNQTDYILVRKRFRSKVNFARTRSFPDHDLLMTTFHLRLKRISAPKHTRLKFHLEKLKHLNVLEAFQTLIGWKFAALIIMNNEDADMDSMITTFNTAVIETANEILGKHRQKRKPSGSTDIVHVCDKRRVLRKTDSNLRIWEIQGSEHQHQELHEKSKETLDRRTV